MSNETILVVDDEKLIRWSLTQNLQKEGYRVVEASTGSEANQIYDRHGADLIIIDLRLPDIDGLRVMKRIHKLTPDTPIIVITAYSSVDTAVEAMKEGAFDYVSKPFNMDDLTFTIRRALETSLLRREAKEHVREQRAKYGLEAFIAINPKMRQIVELVKKIADSEATTVLLRGESGTGKDMIAKAIHYESNRAEKPFMTITCTALQDTLLESELFGHEKGAFTDAKNQKKGLFELAHGGTIFMDEIGDMSPLLQAKVLRSIEEKTFKRVGGTTDIIIDVRVIASTNRDLDKLIAENKFRDDLYYRLNIVTIHIPPLRDRKDEILSLAEYFIDRLSHEFRKDIHDLSKDAKDKLFSYSWPGNVRELRNVIERAVLLGSSDTITAEDIVLGHVSTSPPAPDLLTLPKNGVKLTDIEKNLVMQALEKTGWNQSRAATLLGISRDQVRYRMEKYGLSKKRR